jgi:hypothetical protein
MAASALAQPDCGTGCLARTACRSCCHARECKLTSIKPFTAKVRDAAPLQCRQEIGWVGLDQHGQGRVLAMAWPGVQSHRPVLCQGSDPSSRNDFQSNLAQPGRSNIMKIEFVLNGTPRQEEVRDDEWFLHTLRERCGITSLKDGCSPQGQCGCCVALVDGVPKTTCAMPGQGRHGKNITHAGGLPTAERQRDHRLPSRDRRAAVRLLHPGHRLARQGHHRRDPRLRAKTSHRRWTCTCAAAPAM